MKNMKTLCAAVLLFTTFEAQAEETTLACSGEHATFTVVVDPSHGVRSIKFANLGGADPYADPYRWFEGTKREFYQPREGNSGWFLVSQERGSDYTNQNWLFTLCARTKNSVSSQNYSLLYEVRVNSTDTNYTSEQGVTQWCSRDPENSGYEGQYLSLTVNRATGVYNITKQLARVHNMFSSAHTRRNMSMNISGKCEVAGEARF